MNNIDSVKYTSIFTMENEGTFQANVLCML